MSIVPIRVGNREYDMACDEGQEDHLRLLADEIDERVRALLFETNGSIGENMALLMSALNMADELSENRKEVRVLNSQVVELSKQIASYKQEGPDPRVMEMEKTMAETMDEVSSRIEKIADQLEIQ